MKRRAFTGWSALHKLARLIKMTLIAADRPDLGIRRALCYGTLREDSRSKNGVSGTIKGTSMTRSEALLAILAASGGRPYTPAQIQKAAFLVTRNLPALVTDGRPYNFVPYDYGPFDQSVYADAEAMRASGIVEISPSPHGRWNMYSASDLGVDQGAQLLNAMNERNRDYVTRVSAWVRSLRFEELVKAIYAQYPEMRANSIFRG
jgi:hypothetical protein